MTHPEAAITGLKRQRPEWAPWLAVVEEVARDGAMSEWDSVACAIQSGRNGAPLLDGAAVSLPDGLAHDLFARLVRVASRAGSPKMSGLEAALSPNVDVMTLFMAAVRQDHPYLEASAGEIGADREALPAVAALLAVPFLQACHRRLAASLPESWVEGYCPLCGAWPALAEVRGIDRTRCFRCGRCGAAWHGRALHCPFCATDNHDELVSLVPQKPGTNAVIEACTRCRGYVKTFTKLQGCRPDEVMLEDLGSVDLDVAALELGYARPSSAGYRIAIALNGTQPRAD